jgi:hypothetical protein
MVKSIARWRWLESERLCRENRAGEASDRTRSAARQLDHPGRFRVGLRHNACKFLDSSHRPMRANRGAAATRCAQQGAGAASGPASGSICDAAAPRPVPHHRSGDRGRAHPRTNNVWAPAPPLGALPFLFAGGEGLANRRTCRQDPTPRSRGSAGNTRRRILMTTCFETALARVCKLRALPRTANALNTMRHLQCRWSRLTKKLKTPGSNATCRMGTSAGALTSSSA